MLGKSLNIPLERISFEDCIMGDFQQSNRLIYFMAEICPTCGLPKDLCVCQEIVKEEQRIKVRVENRKWHKEVTVIEGINEKEVDLHELSTKLKSKCACGGTIGNGSNHNAIRGW